MPLVSFKTARARLVIDEKKESILVLRVILSKGERVELATGGNLESLIGVARIRERPDATPGEASEIGTLVFVPSSGKDANEAPAKYQIDISMASKKFDALLKVALAGRLPSKFFVIAGEVTPGGVVKGMGYRVDARERCKFWDNRSSRSLPVTGFSMILPIGVDEHSPQPVSASAIVPRPDTSASHDQVSELANDVSLFHGETKHLLTAVVSLFAVMAVLALLFNLVLLFR